MIMEMAKIKEVVENAQFGDEVTIHVRDSDLSKGIPVPINVRSYLYFMNKNISIKRMKSLKKKLLVKNIFIYRKTWKKVSTKN